MPDLKDEVQANLKDPEGLDPEVDGEDEVGEEVVEVVDDGEDEEEAGEGGEPSESERQATESGWKPKGDWDGEPDDWVSAQEFNRRGELLRKIHNQNRQIKQLDGVVNTLAKQQKKIFDAGYDKAKKELKSRLREAAKDGDDATADVIEDRLEQLEAQKAQDIQALTPSAPVAAVVPEFSSWVERNQWFTKYPEMRGYAEGIGMKYAAENSEKTNIEVYDYVTRTVKAKFPERFGMVTKKVEKKTGSPVEGSGDLNSGRGRALGGTVVRVALSAEEKAVARTLISTGIYKNMNEYAADLKKYGAKS